MMQRSSNHQVARLSTRIGVATAAAAIAIGAVSCGGDDNGAKPTGSGWVIGLNARTPEGSDGYVQIIDSPEEAVTHDLTNAIPMPSAGAVAMVPKRREFLHFSYEEPVVRRYEVDEQGVPKQTGELSFSNTGADSFEQFHTVSSTEMWAAAYARLILVRFDPTTMKITGQVQLGEDLVREGYPDAWAGDRVQRGDKLYFSVGFENWTQGAESALPVTTIVVLDLKTLQYTVMQDDRCAMGMPAAMGDDVIVAASDDNVAGYMRYGYEGFDKEPCMLRLNADGTGFDPAYEKKLSDWTGGKLTGSVEILGKNLAYAKVFNEELTTGPQTNPWEHKSGNYWTWVSFDPSSDEPGKALEGEPSFARFHLNRAGGLNWTIDQFHADNKSTLVILGDTGLRMGASFEGVAGSVGKLGE